MYESVRLIGVCAHACEVSGFVCIHAVLYIVLPCVYCVTMSVYASQVLLSYFNNEGEGLAHADLMTKTYQVRTQLDIGKGR